MEAAVLPRPAPDAPATWREVTPPPAAARDGVGNALVYAIGDIHGCYRLFTRLLGQIAADARARGGNRRPALILCGDYVDRGPQSAQVLEAILWLERNAAYAVHPLMGNHERCLLDFIDDPASGPGWLRWGGRETLVSYGVTPPEPHDGEAALVRARDELIDQMPASHLRLLERLPLTAEVGDYLFVHAGVRPGVPLEEQEEDDLLWIRDEFLDHAGPLPKAVVHGHSWLGDAPQLGVNRIGIDTGAYTTDVLTALRLDRADAAIMQVRG